MELPDSSPCPSIEPVALCFICFTRQKKEEKKGRNNSRFPSFVVPLILPDALRISISVKQLPPPPPPRPSHFGPKEILQINIMWCSPSLYPAGRCYGQRI